VSSPALPGIFGAVEPVLNHYGYLAVAALVMLEDFGIPVPGETVVIAAALFAGAGRLNVVLVGVIATLAAIAGDNIGFAIGHFGGRALALRWGKYVFLTAERLDKAEYFFEHHGGKIIVIARFIEGLRQANGIVAGITGMHWKRFVFFNTIGAALWVGVWVSLGYLAGNHITAIYNQITRYSLYVLIALVVAIVGFVAWRLARRRARRAKQAQRAGQPGRAETAGTPEVAETAPVTETPKAAEAPEAAGASEPIVTSEPAGASGEPPEAAQAGRPPEAAGAIGGPPEISKAGVPVEVSEVAGGTPETEEAPEADGTPEAAGGTPEAERAAEAGGTPEAAGGTPEAERAAEAGGTPEAERAAEAGGASESVGGTDAAGTAKPSRRRLRAEFWGKCCSPRKLCR